MIEALEGGYLVQASNVAFTYSNDDKIRDFDRHSRSLQSSVKWDHIENFIGDWTIHSFGEGNDLPSIIKDVVQRNYIAPGLLKKKTSLLWGLGPTLYTESVEDNKRVRKWIQDVEIQSWLNDWDFESYLLQLCEDYQYVQGVFSKYEQSKGSRINRSFIKELTGIQPDKARLASRRDSATRKATHVITNDWSFESIRSMTEYKVYPLFDFRNPFAKENSILYSNTYSFCTDYYTVPEIYGSLEWLNRSSAVPLIFKAMSRNAINLKFHIQSPQSFWDDKRDKIKNQCTIKGQTYNEQMLIDYQTEFLRKIADVLSGDENTGKYLHTMTHLHVDGVNIKEEGWKVEVIDQKVKDFVESQIKISARADYALSAGIGLHPSLGNVSEEGSPKGGSEQYYALVNYLNTQVDIPEMVICKALNYAIRANFPKKDVKIGFYHNVPEKQEDISPSDRLANTQRP